MAVSLNSKGKAYCMSLIAAGKVDRDSSWSIDAVDTDKLLGDPPDWNAYGRWFMGVDSSAPEDTKEHYKYPFGKNGKVYRRAIIAIKSRAAQQGATAIADAAAAALDKIDGESKSLEACIEKRTVNFDIEVESRSDGELRLRGHAAVFNQETVIGRWFREKIAPGAFIDTIVEDDQRALWNHDPNFVLGRKGNNTLTLSEDRHGLAIEIIPPQTNLIRDLVIAPISRGDVTQMSFTFAITPTADGRRGDEWILSKDPEALDLRIIKHCRVFDVSPVTFPAYEGTDIAIRSKQEWQSIMEAARTPEQKSPPFVDGRINIAITRNRLSLKLKEDFIHG